MIAEGLADGAPSHVAHVLAIVLPLVALAGVIALESMRGARKRRQLDLRRTAQHPVAPAPGQAARPADRPVSQAPRPADRPADRPVSRAPGPADMVSRAAGQSAEKVSRPPGQPTEKVSRAPGQPTGTGAARPTGPTTGAPWTRSQRGIFLDPARQAAAAAQPSDGGDTPGRSG